MTSPRRVGLLVLAALIVAAAALWLSGTRPNRPTPAHQLLLPEARTQVNDISAVRISRGNGTKVTLQRTAKGWQVGERTYPADSTKVRKLLLDLTGLEIVEEKTQDPMNYALLGVEDVKGPQATGTLVEIVAPKATQKVIVGKTSEGRATFVRLADRPASFLVRPQLTIEAEPRRWLDTALLDVDAARVQRIEITPAKGLRYAAVRSSPGAGELEIESLPKGRELSSPGAATALASNLDDLSLDDVRAAGATPGTAGAASAAATEPTPHAIFSTFDGLVVELAGRKADTRSFITVTARHDPALAVAQPNAPEAKEAAAKSDAVKPAASTSQSAAKDTPKRRSAADAQEQAAAISARAQGREFEIPSWKYDAIFRPLEELLKPRS